MVEKIEPKLRPNPLKASIKIGNGDGAKIEQIFSTSGNPVIDIDECNCIDISFVTHKPKQ